MPTPRRVKRVIDFLDAQRPDVFGLFEVEGADGVRPARRADAGLHVPDHRRPADAGDPGGRPEDPHGLHHAEDRVPLGHDPHAAGPARHDRQGRPELRPAVPAPRRAATIRAAWACATTCSSAPSTSAARWTRRRAAPARRSTCSSATSTPWAWTYPFDRSIDATIELAKWDRYAARAKIGMRRLAEDPRRDLVQRQQVIIAAVESRPRLRLDQPQVQGLQAPGCAPRRTWPCAAGCRRRRMRRKDAWIGQLLRSFAAVLRSALLRRLPTTCFEVVAARVAE